MKLPSKEMLIDVLLAVWDVLFKHGRDVLLPNLVIGPIANRTAVNLGAKRFTGSTRLITVRALSARSIDGAIRSGPDEMGWAKFAIRKGLPEEGEKRMAVENDPHTVDDFSGEIKEGYGKGIKKLIYGGPCVVKIKGGLSFVSKVNVHEHKADKVGLHYDIVAEGIEPGSREFEIHIPGSSEAAGRYAFRQPEGFKDNQVLIVRMKDYGLIVPKPPFVKKERELLAEIDKHPTDEIFEWKADGSLANVVIKEDRAIFRSHRAEGETYYDRLPALEWLKNRSRLFTNRMLFPHPNQDGTVLKGELFHPEGAARVGGILNSSPEKAIAYQQEHGPVEFYVWDILKFHGKDVSEKPYAERRLMYEQVVRDIQRFNPHFMAVPRADNKAFGAFYDAIVADKRGLPFSEGGVIKHGNDTSGKPWIKIKFRDTYDVQVVDIIEGIGKRKGMVGRFLVESAGGGRGEIGSFKASDDQLRWMWKNRDILKGQVAEIYAQEITKAGAPRAGVFYRWHPSKSEAALLMSMLDDRKAMYKVKSAAGWRRKK